MRLVHPLVLRHDHPVGLPAPEHMAVVVGMRVEGQLLDMVALTLVVADVAPAAVL